jgi:nitroimidazol reductase NimA-like FMN-containing flavoprotein (pyridoxamine 5'-phosphate oxidase superfamily)
MVKCISMKAMRREDRAIEDDAEIAKIINHAQVGRLGLSMNDQPYVVPVNFAFDHGRIYFHCADTGMKLDFLRHNAHVCFEIDEHLGTVPGAAPCLFGTAYRSVIAFGVARILSDSEEKAMATKVITIKYAGKEMADKITKGMIETYRSSRGSRLVVVEIKVDKITGKHRENTESK